ncbi:MAG: hypothetical protein V1913_06585 [Fibrobacterota bacterium]
MSEFSGLPDFSFTNSDADINIRPVAATGADGDMHKGGKERHPQHPATDEAKDHFIQLTKAAADSNAILVSKKSPYRFCVYREDQEVFIDIVILDSGGKIAAIKKKNITHDEFVKWLRHIEEREGLFLDETI